MKMILLMLMLAVTQVAAAQTTSDAVLWNTPGAGNPLLPGYFADPTIRKFGDTYYIYATTDGTGNGYGPPQVWVSKDFVNWRNVLLNWPTTEVVWAPDVVEQPDGTYRYYYCTPCQVYVGESSSPVGPWTNRLGSPEAVLVPDRFVHNAITLDPALFRDDDGSEYLYFGTWGIYKGFGCGVARLTADGKSFTDKKLIPNTEITDFFEAPYVFKRNGVYYFTYSSGSCHDDTYRVQYATSTEGPMGPYTYKGCILKTNADGTIHGPGHHSVLVENGQYYIVYHRHNNPHSIHGFHRQVCIDKMEFDAEGNIKEITPTHKRPDIGPKNKKAAVNLAYGANVTASSHYSEWFKPEYAVDDNNGTLWRAHSCKKRGSKDEHDWLQIDLGKLTKFNQVWTQFEYATFFYQYLIETSLDGTTWTIFADRRENTQQGSPMIDKKEVKARYIRITITDTQKAGHFPAIWNVKVFNATKKNDPEAMLPNPQIDEAALVRGYPWIHKKDVEQPENVLVTQNGWEFGIDADNYKVGERVQGVLVVPKDRLMAFRFTGKERMEFEAPQIVYNSPYTITAWVFNPEVDGMETIMQLNSSRAELATTEFRSSLNPTEGIIAHNASMENTGARDAVKPGVWQRWIIIFDGFNESIYCDGKKVSEKNIFLMQRPEGKLIVGQTANGTNPFSGYIHSLHVYDFALSDGQRLTYEGVLHYTNPVILKGHEDELRPATFNLQPITPTLVEVQLTEQSAKTNGLIDYRFGCGTDSTCLDGAPVMNVENEGIGTVRTTLGIRGEKGEKVFVKLRDIYSRELPVLTKDIKVGKKDFIDKFSSQTPITLTSSATNLRYEFDERVPMQTVEVSGDFVLECHIADMTGLKTHNVPAYNEGGILLQRISDDGKTQNVVQLGAFPLYNCGNMITVVSRRGRPQFPNQKGYRFDPWMQIQRQGDTLTFRTSPDGKTWTEMTAPGIDFARILGTGSIRAGIYQTTYTDANGSVIFDNVHLWQKK